MSELRPIWALLVGIDHFLAVNDLDGCGHDVGAMYGFLRNGYAVPEANIRMLRDEAATRQGIIDAFFEHLVDNDAIRPGDQILFHFSGHGANMLDPLDASPTGLIESLVAHDSGIEGVFNIPDTTVAAMLELLAAKRGTNITVVLDCCHSGSGTRAGGKKAPRTRLTEPDTRVPPKQLDAEIVQAAKAMGVGKRWREEGLPYTLLAACRDRELAQEYIDYFEDGEPAYGAFTWHLTDALWKLQPGTSYAMLHEAVAAQVNAYNPYQMPQLEGVTDRAVFGALTVRRDPFITVTGVEKGELLLSSGRVHGVGKNAILNLYPREVQTLDDLPPEPIATAQVTSVGPSTSKAYASIANPESLLLARAIVEEPGEVAPKRTVAFEADDDATDAAKAALEELKVLVDRSQLVTPATGERAEFVVRAEGEALVIRGNDEPDPLVEPASIGCDAGKAVTALDSIARFRRVAGLRNDEPGSRIQGSVGVRFRQYVEGARPQDMPIVEPTDSEVSLVYDPEVEESPYLIEVVNNSPNEIYVTVLMLYQDYSIAHQNQESSKQSIDPGRSFFVGHTAPYDMFLAWLPGDAPGEPLWTTSHNRVKVVATLKPTDLTLLLQPGLDVPPPGPGHRSAGLEALISQGVTGHRMGRRRGRKTEDWGTGDLAFSVVRKPADVRIEAGRSALGEGITLHAPDGFSGRAELATMGQATRGAGGLALPPGLRDGFKTLGLPGSRGAGGGVVVSLTLDEAQRAKIAPDNPLRLEARGSDDLWPIAFDGEDFVLAGRPERGGARITHLPPADGPASRGALERTLKLYFYKKTGQEEPTVGLHTVRMVDGQPQYADTRPEDTPKGGRALLVVHGFASGTLGQTRVLAPALSSLSYDTILAYDYESFGTPIAENGAALAEALMAAGFGADDGRTLDVFAHSMGGLVSRAMVELAGGARYVDRMVLAGSPNNGTPLMNRVKSLETLINIAINKVLGPAVGGVLAWLLRSVVKAAVGPADLAVGSDFLDRLNRPSGGRIPYLALDGRAPLVDDDAGFVKRMAAKGAGVALGLLFGEPHDLVVGSKSITGIQGGAYPALSAVMTRCNHFDYLTDEASLDAVRGFLASGGADA